MTAIASSLTKGEDGLPLVGRSALQQLAGVMRTLTRTEFNSALTLERSRIANNGVGIYNDGERIAIVGEEGERLWVASTAANSHARTVRVGGRVFLLDADTNTVTKTTGAPSSGTGANGDLAIDYANLKVYKRTSGAWAEVTADMYGNTGAVGATEKVGLQDQAGRFTYVQFTTYIKRIDNGSSPPVVAKATSTDWANRVSLTYV